VLQMVSTFLSRSGNHLADLFVGYLNGYRDLFN